ncbi:unnamed protein product [Prunus armeniaca]
MALALPNGREHAEVMEGTFPSIKPLPMTVPRARSKKNNTLSAERPKRNNPLATDKVAQLRDGTRAMMKLMLARERATTEAIKDQGSSRKYRPKIGKVYEATAPF